jgi:hypothetical protein
LGDGLNDATFLRAVNVPVLIPSAQTMRLKSSIPRGMVTRLAGPEGWNEAVLSLLGVER